MTVLVSCVLLYRLYYPTGESEKKCIFSPSKLLNFAKAELFNPVAQKINGNYS